MQPPVFRLQSLPVQLREHALSFVPLRDKLLQLAHLSHDFGRLTPACFSENGLELSAAAVMVLTQSASLRRLLSRVRDVSVSTEHWRQERRAGASELAQSVPPLLRLFSQLQTLSVEVDTPWGRRHETVIALWDVLPSLPQLPLLRSLSIGGQSVGRKRRVISLSELALLSGLPSLRSLTLRNMPLPAGSLSLLCSLPLEHLDLRDADLGDGPGHLRDARPVMTDEPAPLTAGVSSTLRRLHLPDPCWWREQEIRRVLAAFGSDRIGRELRRRPVQLELADIRHGAAVRTELQQLQLRIPSLTAISLVVAPGVSLSLQPASAGLMLPQLRCVSLELRSHPGWRVRRRRGRLAEVAAECVGFLQSCSSQLLRLDVTELPCLPAAAAVLEAAFHCQQLRRLELQRAEGEEKKTTSSTAVSFTPLPQLHTLKLRNLDISAAQLSALLCACPAVEHIELYDMPTFTLELLPVIGRSCRRLKQLDAQRCSDLFSQPVEAQLTAAELADSSVVAVFPQLVALALTIGEICKAPRPPRASPPTLQWLLGLLHSAPVLRFLRLDLRLRLSELLAFSSLTGLRGFILEYWNDWQQRFFCDRQQPDRLPLPDSTGWQPVHEADRELQLVSDFHGWESGLFRADTERFQGRTGREAFFAAVEARLASGEDESESESEDSWSSDEDDCKHGLSTAEDDLGDGSDQPAVTALVQEEKDGAREEEEEGDAQGLKRRRVQDS